MKCMKTEPMHVRCEHCLSESVTSDLSDFREVGHTYPPTVYFVCPDCEDESRVFDPPARLVQHLTCKISRELGLSHNIHFAIGSSVSISSSVENSP